MQSSPGDKHADAGPKRRPRHYSYDESVDEAPRLIEDEPVEVERAVPAEENESVQKIEKEDEPAPPAFDEGDASRDEPHE